MMQKTSEEETLVAAVQYLVDEGETHQNLDYFHHLLGQAQSEIGKELWKSWIQMKKHQLCC